MLFENVAQYQKAKETLLDNNRDIDKTARILKKSPLFSNLSEGEIISQLAELNEGLGDTIMNFLSSSFGGDVSKLKTVLTQMKEQELKFNREEYEIWEEFYRLIEDQNALDKDKDNPNYREMSRSLQQARNALNLRLKELTKGHYEIFNALEQRVKDLTKDSNRKKKYFNAQRATDVEETRSDRYEKVKAITSRSVNRAKQLEDFFNVSVSDVEKEREEARKRAEREVQELRRTPTSSEAESPRQKGVYDQSPEKEFHERLESIKSTPGGYRAKKKSLEDLEDDIFKTVMEDDRKKTAQNPHGELGETSRYNINQINIELQKIIKQLLSEKEAMEAKEAKEKAQSTKRTTTR